MNGVARLTKIIATEGLHGIAARLSTRIQRARRRLVRRWVDTDQYWLGRFIELTGNRSALDGISISLDAPAIATALKSRFIKGIYELPERRLLKHLPTNLPVVDLGACIGVTSCLINRRLQDPAKHIAVEANSELLGVLKRNRDTNGARFQIVHAALGYEEMVTFYLHEKFVGGSADRKTPRSVTCLAVTLEQIGARLGDRISVVCDIEGGEVSLLEREQEYLKNHVATLILETHAFITGSERVQWIHWTLGNIGFAPIENAGSVYCYRNTELS